MCCVLHIPTSRALCLLTEQRHSCRQAWRLKPANVGSEAEVLGILYFEVLLWWALYLRRTWFEWLITLEPSLLTNTSHYCRSWFCTPSEPDFLLTGVGKWMAFESVSGFWGIVTGTLSLPAIGRWSCSFLPAPLCSLFSFFLSSGPIFSFPLPSSPSFL